MAKYFDVQAAIKDGADPQGIQDYMKANNLSPYQAPPVAPPPPAPSLMDNILGIVKGGAQALVPQAYKYYSQTIPEDINLTRNLLSASPQERQQMAPQVQDAIKNTLNQKDKSILESSSYLVPFGKVTSLPTLLTKALLPGFAQGAIHEVAQDNPTLDSVVKSGAYGAGGAGLVGGALGLTGGLGGVANKAGAALEDAGSAMRQGVSKIQLEPGVFGAAKEKTVQNTLDSLGIKGNAAQKYEQLGPNMQKLGDQIQTELYNNPKSVPLDDVSSALKQNLSDNRTLDLTGVKANKAVSGVLDSLFPDAAKSGGVGNFPKEVGTDQLFKIKQELNADYGIIQKKINNGVPLTDKEKVLSIARKTLDDIIAQQHPNIKQATLMQSNLYDAADSLAKSRNAPSTMQIFGNTIPKEVSQGVSDLAGGVAQKVGRTVKSIKLPNITGNPILNQLLGSGAAASANILSSVFPNSPSYEAQNQNANIGNQQPPNNINNDVQHTNSIAQEGTQQQTGQLTPDIVKKAYLMLPPALADRVASAYKAQLGGTDAKTRGLVTGGLQSLNDVQDMLSKDPNLLAKQLIPGGLATRKFDAALEDSIRNLIYLKTGTAANADEIKAYKKTVGPTLGDSPEAIQYKLDLIKRELQGYMQQQ